MIDCSLNFFLNSNDKLLKSICTHNYYVKPTPVFNDSTKLAYANYVRNRTFVTVRQGQPYNIHLIS